MTKTITCHWKGWMLFCPIYHEGDPHDPWNEFAPIPRWRMWWLLDITFAVQQGINWMLSYFNPDACGFWAYLKPLKKPVTVTFNTKEP